MIGAVVFYGVLAFAIFIISGGEIFPWRRALGVALLWPLFVLKFVLFALAEGAEALVGSDL